MDWSILLPALIAASPGLIALILAWRKARTEKAKSDADTAKVIVDAAGGIVILKEKQVKELEVEINDLRARVNILEQTVDLLERQLLSLGHTPATKEEGP